MRLIFMECESVNMFIKQWFFFFRDPNENKQKKNPHCEGKMNDS